jgi:hypothetical protein
MHRLSSTVAERQDRFAMIAQIAKFNRGESILRILRILRRAFDSPGSSADAGSDWL